MVISVVALIRLPRPVMAVMMLLLLGLPIAGLVAYVVDPGPVPDPGPVLWLAFIPAIAGIAAGAWMLAFMARQRASLTVAELERLSNGTLVMVGGLMLALSAVTALWQPAYGIANVAVNAVWAAIWILPRLRRMAGQASVEIRAPRARVYSFVADPANWARYQEGVEAVSVAPPGALAEGSEVTVTQRYDSPVRGPRLLPAATTLTSTIDSIEPERSISMHIKGRPESRSETEFEDVEEGTRVTTRTRASAPYRMAVFGALLELQAQKSARLARARRNLEALKGLLER